jgi:hypothetical protein
MKKVLLFAVCVLMSLHASAQKNSYKGFPSVIWPKLYDIKYVTANDGQGEYDKPVFSTAAKSLDGKVITVPGYIVPFETGMKSSHFMLSSLPLSTCFFCGGAGPETVVEIFMKDEIAYSDKPVEITGRLKLNASDPEKMIYILLNSEVTAEGF